MRSGIQETHPFEFWRCLDFEFPRTKKGNSGHLECPNQTHFGTS